MDRDHWHKTVHGNLDYEKLLPKNPALRELLDSLKMPKYIFTNADTVHANVCLEHIGIKDCFDGIISFDCMHDWAKRQGGDASKKAFAKPERKAFEVGEKGHAKETRAGPLSRLFSAATY